MLKVLKILIIRWLNGGIPFYIIELKIKQMLEMDIALQSEVS